MCLDTQLIFCNGLPRCKTGLSRSKTVNQPCTQITEIQIIYNTIKHLINYKSKNRDNDNEQGEQNNCLTQMREDLNKN